MRDFGHRLTLDSIHDGDRMDMTADEDERCAVAQRLNLVSLERLEAHVMFHRDGKSVRCEGRVKARLTQACTASGEPVAAQVDERFVLAFVEAIKIDAPEAELELGADELDIIFHDGQAIDLGAAIADTLGLALDPYPRGPRADEALKAAGVLSEAEAGPFAALARLKTELGS